MAEKRAAVAPLKLMFPLFVFIFPTIFVVLFGPVALMAMHQAWP
jgi:tight adherence protein C